MNDDEKYKRLDFIISIIKPWDELHAFLQLPYALDKKFSDPVIKARMLAVTIQHQTDYDKSESGSSLNDEDLRAQSPEAMRIRDFCNTIKHINRNGGKPHAQIIGVKAEAIVNSDKSFQFLRNKILYKHDTEGEFDLMNDLYKAARFWADRRQIDLSGLMNWDVKEVRVNAKSPQEAIFLIHDPEICIYQESQDITTNKLENGKLVPMDFETVKLAILDSTSISEEQKMGLFS
ncbi:hypothetical protein [Vibrio sp. SCSIO 43169]|uniref:hypothetical protein n=1 Tax=Vibrio sp. SCSIO 43169 TaxID=2822801 RepID=UPI0020446DAC|nr:hypothetical protein [Vibrio sp. SCSIO 43169]MCM5507116.1 hypothetical protein [Vibrio sp. SCSIO 43169]